MVKKTKETLSDKIAGVLNTAPASLDPEDDGVDDTTARLDADFSSENEEEEQILSKFRRQNVDLLEDLDQRYAGKKSSRKSLKDPEHDLSESEHSEEENIEDNVSDKSGIESEGSNEQESEEDEEESGEDEENSGSDGAEAFEDDHLTDQNDFKHVTDSNLSFQVKKGLCVRNQMNMWENLLEMRIQLQKCLITANKMPQINSFIEIKKQSGPEFTKQVATAKKSLTNVLDKLLLLQKLVQKKFPETKNLNKPVKDQNLEKEDEEIPSDTEDEKSVEDIEEELEEEETPKKKRKLHDFENEINNQHNIYKNYRNGIIQKWNEKTRIAVMKNNANSHSIINHIEHTLSDRKKLIKRTQLKRSDYTILGQETEKNVEISNEEEQQVRPTDEYNTEIFDDDDFYHQLLRELIEVKSADLTDPVQLGRQWIQLQNLRSKMKRKIDTRATKGRKIMYTVHTKLVNFMAPINGNSWTDEAKSELYGSLFGKKQQFGTV